MKYIDPDLLGTMEFKLKERIEKWYQRRILNGFSKEESKVFSYEFLASKCGYRKDALPILIRELEKTGFLKRLDETTIELNID